MGCCRGMVVGAQAVPKAQELAVVAAVREVQELEGADNLAVAQAEEEVVGDGALEAFQ